MHKNFVVFNISVPSYGAMVLIGISIVITLGILVALRRKLDIGVFLKLELTGGIFAYVGAKAWCLFEKFCKNVNADISWKAFESAGYSFYGGMLLGLLAVFITACYLKINFEEYVRNLIFLIPLLHAFWKIGCFLGGCCYGVPYEKTGCVIFPKGVKAPSGIPIFPVQLLESAVLFLMAIIFYIRGKREWRCPILEYIGSYSVIRFFIEFLRYHEKKVFFSFAQWVSVICLFTVILFFSIDQRMISKRRKGK